MSCSGSLFIFISLSVGILLSPVAPSTPQYLGACSYTADYCWKCTKTGTYAPADTYRKNLKKLLSSISANTQITSGFNRSSLGQNPNKVNAIALCRGDLTQLDSCHNCLNQSSYILMQNCSKQKEAIIWAERCMVRYSHKLIFGIEQEDPIQFVPSPNRAKNAQQFASVLNPLLNILSERAASSSEGLAKKFAAGHAPVPEGETIYAVAQCTPDINQKMCKSCLKKAVSNIPQCCGGLQGGRVLKPSCNVRFEVGLFFEPTSDILVNISASCPTPRSST